MRRPPSGPAPPPFDGAAVRRLRAQLGMTHGQVAHAMRVSYGLRVRPETVAAWERGEAVPDGTELPALAGALWCAPAELMTVPRTLLEHRLARGMAASDLARAVGVGAADYDRMERRGQWSGNARQTAALGVALGLAPPALLAVTGQEPRLAELLRAALGTRWQPYARRVEALVPVRRERISAALRLLHADYQSVMVTTLAWGPSGAGSGADGADGRAFLDEVVARFWTALRDAP
ncbi:helix-turn-helix transcriptional regulator [Actinacidiphila alni]|uniref:helix-turn-helix domain-containing protein n=1 Tax=Actinacidiphila alni TaxID=380248 RepID=UPI003403B030